MEVAGNVLMNSLNHEGGDMTGRIGAHHTEETVEKDKPYCPLDDQSSLLKPLPDIKATTGDRCGPKKAGSMRRLLHSLPSERSMDSGWSNLDSVHSTTLDWADSSKNDSFVSMSTSSSSFESFGESGDDVVADSLASKAFTQLKETPTPRAVMMKQHSMRLRRGSSYRGSLDLIEETNLD